MAPLRVPVQPQGCLSPTAKLVSNSFTLTAPPYHRGPHMEKEMRQYKLMIPGPVDVPDEVMAAMATSMPHYGDEWLGIYTETQDNLK